MSSSNSDSFFVFVFCLFRTPPMAYGCSQARRRVGAVATSLHHSRSNRSEPCLWLKPQHRAVSDPYPIQRGQGLNLCPHGYWSDLFPLSHGGNSKIDFKIKKVTGDKEWHYIIIKVSIQEDDITIVNIYASNIGPPLYKYKVFADLHKWRNQ